ncbi:MAG: MBL fold metallo-hydrolase [Lentisphaerae bacterium]|nr:MBL fold metallo-hydrolase [Lentisphaerota bacterium]
MSLRLCVLGSSSAGNCTFVASDATRILIDAGLSFREVAGRLAVLGEDAAALAAVCITHEHDDHTSALAVLHRRVDAALYANSGTIDGLRRSPRLSALPWNVFVTGSAFQVGDLTITPFSVPHDAYDPVGFTVRCGDAAAGIVTDMGTGTTLIREHLRACRVVVVESNHDAALLRDARRPWSLKQRIAGRQGHLSNAQAGALLADLSGSGLQAAFLAHLSADCNRPDLALREVRAALAAAGRENLVVHLTYRDRPSAMAVVG